MINSTRAILMTQGGPNSGTTFHLSTRPVTLGRRSDNDLVVDDKSVSRRHALIMETANGFVIRDLNSTNGTFLNRNRIGEGEHLLRHGDTIRLAASKVVFIFQAEGEDTLKLHVDSPVTGSIGLEQPSPNAAEAYNPVKEIELMRFLEANRGTPVSSKEIAKSVWPELPYGSEAEKQVRKAIEAIRNRIETNPRKPTKLLSVGEFGYLFL